MENEARRAVLQSTIFAAASLALAPVSAGAQNLTGGSLTADLMHDHGLVRHALAIYQHAAYRLQQERLDLREQAVLSKSLNETARIFHEHAENYHAKAIEETHMFPMLMKMPQPISRYPALLIAQHERGMEMTAYLIDVTRDGNLPMDRAAARSRALLAFKQMYEYHALHEDTFVYLAWQNALSPAGRTEMRDAFAEIEQRMLGQNAYDEAFNRLVTIEGNLGIADLAQYTMPDIRTY